jgi:hypothetical protein
MAYRLGWVLYWTCVVFAGLWATMVLSAIFNERGPVFEIILLAAVPALGPYAHRRNFRGCLTPGSDNQQVLFSS